MLTPPIPHPPPPTTAPLSLLASSSSPIEITRLSPWAPRSSGTSAVSLSTQLLVVLPRRTHLLIPFLSFGGRFRRNLGQKMFALVQVLSPFRRTRGGKCTGLALQTDSTAPGNPTARGSRVAEFHVEGDSGFENLQRQR